MTTGGELSRLGAIRWVDETDSTNADVLALARSGAPEATVVATEFQRAGRGRRGRRWIAPPGSALLASILLRPDLAPEKAARATMAAALAAADACRALAGVDVALKWPNDLVVDTGIGAPAKLAGLLAESIISDGRLEAVVVGMGCNLTPAAAGLPGATCLDYLAGRAVEARPLLAAWLEHLAGRYPSLTEGTALLEDYRRHCLTLGQAVRVELADAVVEGTAVDVDDGGRLLVDTATGRQTLAVGDVVHLSHTIHLAPGG